MSDQSSFQISGNIGNGYFILKGATVAEVEQQSLELRAAFDRIADNLTAVQQIALVKEAFSAKDKPAFGGNKGGAAPAATGGGTRTYQPKQGGSSGGSGAAISLGPDGKGTCGHGAKLLDYVKKDGKRVHGWYCNEKDRDKSCKALTLDGHGQ